MKIQITVNGTPRELDLPGLRRLLDVLREDLGLTGTKEGCGEGECGACTVLLNGKAVNACLVPVCQLDGAFITTVEGLTSEEGLDQLQEAFVREGGIQCGICTPGILLTAKELLDTNKEPTPEEIRRHLAGNLCRCTGYSKIVASVAAAAARRRAR